jgi:hypothetical protein
MRMSVVQVVLMAYLILVSFLSSTWQWWPFASFVVLFLLQFSGWRLSHEKENLACVLIALSVNVEVLLIFAAYLPFLVFGQVFKLGTFAKRYIFGFSASVFVTILLYVVGAYFSMPMTQLTIALFFLAPVVIGLWKIPKGERGGIWGMSTRECILILVIVGATFFVAGNILTNDSLFISNGTYQYTKFELIVKSVETRGVFPLYDPGVSQGEAPFLFESPLTFSHIAFTNILLSFITPVKFYNAYVVFTLLLATLGLSLLLRTIAEPIIGSEKKDILDYAAITIGALSIGLNFYFVQLLESFKAFFTFPINYLILSIIIGWRMEIKDSIVVMCLLPLTFIAHTPHGLGILLIAGSMALLHAIRISRAHEIGQLFFLVKEHLWVLIGGICAVLLFPLFYVASSIIFEDALEAHPPFEWKSAPIKSVDYLKGRLRWGEPLSLSYPDTKRNDQKVFGPFISVVGLLCLAMLLLLIKRSSLRNFRLFLGGYALHVGISAVIINSSWVGSLEYSYRTIDPYLLILLVSSIVLVTLLITNKMAKAVAVIIFALSVFHFLPVAKENLERVHVESIIGGETFRGEIEFIKRLPHDGRIITYGLFANAVDPAMASLADHWFSRFHLTQYARSRSVYAAIHESHSFGENQILLGMSGGEIANHLKLGGYKYIFMDIRHPVSAFLVQQLYPNYTYPLYQNNALVILVVNGTSYVEKINVVRQLPLNVYKEKNGYRYVAIGPYYTYKQAPIYSVAEVKKPESLSFERRSPTEVIITGPFEDGEWVVFKETYSSRWKASIDGKVVPTFASSHNLLLTQTTQGGTLTLRYQVLPIEKVLGGISFAGILGVLLLFILLM